MNGLQSTLDTIDRVLVECDAGPLPPLGYTCLRPSCGTGVTTWINPYYCSEKCRAADNPKEEQAHRREITVDQFAGAEVRIGQVGADPADLAAWTSIGHSTHDDLPEPTSPVTLGWDPAGGAVAAAQLIGNHTHVQLVAGDPTVSEFIRQIAEQRAWELTAWQEQLLIDLYRNNDAFHRVWMNQITAGEPGGPDHIQRALERRRNRNTGPQRRTRAPRNIPPRRSR